MSLKPPLIFLTDSKVMADHLSSVFACHLAKGPVGVDDSFVRKYDHALIKREKHIPVVDRVGRRDDFFKLVVFWEGHILVMVRVDEQEFPPRCRCIQRVENPWNRNDPPE
ncbi:hypothetical protein [Desulfoplanes sp.]